MDIRRFSQTSALLVMIPLAFVACTGNWPRFRGPESNMIAEGKDLPSEWGNEQNLKWKHPLKGRGWSSPITWGNRIFLTEAILDMNSLPADTVPPEERAKENPQDAVYRWMVSCIDMDSGELIWERTAFEGKPGIRTHRENTYASETPVTDGKRVYAYFGMTGLYCFDFDGNLVWEKDLGAFKTQSDWGSSTSPLLYGDKLYLQLDSEEGSFLIAMDKYTGEEIWRVGREEKTNWSTPVIWKNRVGTELVTAGQKARSYDPETGTLIWELNLGGGRNISSPVANRKLLFTGNEKRGDGGGFLFAVKAGSKGDITPPGGDSTSSGVLWRRANSGLSMPSPLLYKGCIYILDRSGFIFCYEESTGMEVYPRTRVPEAAPFWASPWAHDGRIWCLDERGTTHSIGAGKEFGVLSRNSIDDKFWSSPAISDHGYVFRGVSNLYYVE